MEMKKILLVIGFVFFGLGGIQVIHAQDKMRLDNLDRAYMFIPDSLSPEDYLKRFEAAEKQTNEFIAGLTGDEKKWAALIRYKGILAIKDQPRRLIFQGVQCLYSADWDREWQAGEVRQGVMVFIGLHLPEEEIRQQFALLTESVN